jgi:DNA-binding NarL/FixJ family response regulator
MRTTTRKIRILIADDHSLVRSGLRALLESSQGFAIVAEYSDGEQVLQMAEKHNPDVVMLDISMPKMNGVEATRILKRQHPHRANLMQKLDIHEKAGLVRYAIQNGIVDLHE